MPRYDRFPFVLAVLLLGFGAAGAASAQALDLRAASQRACVAAAERAGYHVLRMDRPVPQMVGGANLGVRSESIRMDVAYQGAATRLRCVYRVHDMEARLYTR